MLCRAVTSPRVSTGSMAQEDVVPSVASSMHGSSPAAAHTWVKAALHTGVTNAYMQPGVAGCPCLA